MPCYDPPLPPDVRAREIAEWRSRNDKDWYTFTPKEDIEQWLCDALRGSAPHPDCLRWWELHKRFHDSATG